VIPSSLLDGGAAYRTYGSAGNRLGCGFASAGPDQDRIDVSYPFFALGWVLRGAVEYTDTSGARTSLGVGDAFLQLPGCRHSVRYRDATYSECWLELGGGTASFPEAAGLVERARPVLAPGIDLSLVRRFDRARSALREAPESDLPILAGDLVGLVAAIVRLDRRSGQDPYAALIDEACRLLELRPEPRGPLERLARRHCLSYERFRKVFADRVGCAPRAYGQRRRLDRARELLLSGGRTLAEIADELGYANAASFSAQFIAQVGLAPGRFRDQRRHARDQRRR
jgi:AraC-like DNA-binding protein